MPTALSGDPANRTFYVYFDKSEIVVDYLYYLGNQKLEDNCYYTIKDYETPDPEDFGYETLEEMDFDACGYSEQIAAAIEAHIDNLES